MKIDVQLPPTFTDCNTCTLEAFIFRTVRTPPRHHGWPLKLSGMEARVLSLRLDSSLHSFEEARGDVKYLGGDPQHAIGIKSCAVRMLAVRKIVTTAAITLLLTDESIGKTLGVIGESIAWDPEGLAVRLVIGRDEIVV